MVTTLVPMTAGALLRRIVRLVAQLAVALLLPSVSTAQTTDPVYDGKTLLVRVSDTRPVARAIQILEDVCGCAINYEEPAYSSSDLVEQQLPGSEKPTKVPRPGTFEVRRQLEKESLAAMLPDVLNDVLSEAQRAGVPGNYRLAIHGKRMSVVPDYSRGSGEEGRLPLLDAEVAMRPLSGTVSEALGSLALELSRFSGFKVLVGTVPGSALSLPVNLKASRGRARFVLSDILDAVPDGIVSWRVLYDPRIRVYVINVRVRPSSGR